VELQLALRQGLAVAGRLGRAQAEYKNILAEEDGLLLTD
jgi:hypothetical protein